MPNHYVTLASRARAAGATVRASAFDLLAVALERRSAGDPSGAVIVEQRADALLRECHVEGVAEVGNDAGVLTVWAVAPDTRTLRRDLEAQPIRRGTTTVLATAGALALVYEGDCSVSGGIPPANGRPLVLDVDALGALVLRSFCP